MEIRNRHMYFLVEIHMSPLTAGYRHILTNNCLVCTMQAGVNQNNWKSSKKQGWQVMTTLNCELTSFMIEIKSELSANARFVTTHADL